MKKMTLLLGFTLLTTVALTGCSKEEEVVATPSTASSFTGISVGTTTTAAPVTPVVVEEMVEEEIDVMTEATPEYHVVETFDTTGAVDQATVVHFPEKVVFLDYVAIDMVTAWGLTDKFIPLVVEGDMPSYLVNTPLDGIEFLETNPIEGDVLPLMEFAPDLIFANEESDIIFDTLSMIAPTLTYHMKMPTTYESFLVVARRNAAIFGSEIVSINEEILSGFDIRMNKIKEYGKSQTAVVLMNTEDGLMPLGADSDSCSMIFTDLGFTNLAADFDGKEGDFTFKDLLELDPDCLFVLNTDETIGISDFLVGDDLEASSAWSNHKVVTLDAEIWTLMEGGILSMDIMLRNIENGLSDELSNMPETGSSTLDAEETEVEVTEKEENAEETDKSEAESSESKEDSVADVKEEEKSSSEESVKESVSDAQEGNTGSEGEKEQSVGELQDKVTDLESKFADLEEMLLKLEASMAS